MLYNRYNEAPPEAGERTSMTYDNSALIAAKQKVDRLSELKLRQETIDEALRTLSVREPVLAQQLRKETAEREELSRKMRNSSLYSKLHRKEFAKELREADEAEAAYAQAGADYERLQKELDAIVAEMKSLEKAEAQYRDLFYVTLKEVSALINPTGRKVAKLNDRLAAIKKERTQIQKAIGGSKEMVTMVTNLDEVLTNMAAVGARNLEVDTWLGSIETFLGLVKKYQTRMTEAVKGLSPDAVAMVEADKLRESLSLVRKGYTDTARECARKGTSAFQPDRLRHAIQLMYSGTNQLGNRLLSVSARLREYEARIEGEYKNTVRKTERILLGPIT